MSEHHDHEIEIDAEEIVFGPLQGVTFHYENYIQKVIPEHVPQWADNVMAMTQFCTNHGVNPFMLGGKVDFDVRVRGGEVPEAARSLHAKVWNFFVSNAGDDMALNVDFETFQTFLDECLNTM